MSDAHTSATTTGSGRKTIIIADEDAELFGLPDGQVTELDRECRDFLRNDVGNAQRLIKRFGDDLIYVKEVGWHYWTGTHWDLLSGEREASLRAHETANLLMMEAKSIKEDGPFAFEDDKAFQKRFGTFYRFAIDSGNSGRLAAMLKQAEPYLTKNVDQMNADPRLFNVANGTLELRSEKEGGIRLRRHKRKDLITRISPVKYDANATSPAYAAFLDRVMPSIPIQGYLQRWAGYSLTGDTGEQCLSLFYGSGANGKSTMVDIWAYIAGDYALSLPMASLLHDDRKRGSEANPDIARLVGVRMVSSGETNAGARFDEALLKQLTGGDTITARHLNKGFFDFKAEFKLMLSFNNKPSIRGQDEGIWRRMKMVPFDNVIPKNERDPNLPKKLKAEASGILNWMLDGLRLWLERGLDVPPEVSQATEDYRSEMDPIGQFLNDATQKRETAHVQATVLYDAFCRWCGVNGRDPSSRNAFGRAMTNRGYDRTKVGVAFYRGLELINDYHDQQQDNSL